MTDFDDNDLGSLRNITPFVVWSPTLCCLFGFESVSTLKVIFHEDRILGLGLGEELFSLYKGFQWSHDMIYIF